VSSWTGRGFDEDPPNAAIVVDGGKRDADTLIVELTHPKLDQAGRISYVAKHIDPPAEGALAASARRADDHLPRKLGAVHLFIDDAPSMAVTQIVASLATTGRVALIFDNATVALQTGASPVANNWVMNGFGELGVNSVQFFNKGPTYTGQPGGVGFAVQPTATELKGTAYLSDGAESVEIQVGGPNGPRVTLGAGPFSIPLS
jgi:hypothetical protein